MTHIVKFGETLTSIAKKYGTTVEALVASNGIKNKNLIFPGQVLQIPVKNAGPDIGEQLATVLDDIEALPSFKVLEKML